MLYWISSSTSGRSRVSKTKSAHIYPLATSIQWQWLWHNYPRFHGRIQENFASQLEEIWFENGKTGSKNFVLEHWVINAEMHWSMIYDLGLGVLCLFVFVCWALFVCGFVCSLDPVFSIHLSVYLREMPLHLSFLKSNPELTLSVYMIYSLRPWTLPRVHGRAVELEIATCFEVNHPEVLSGGGQREMGREGGGERCCLEKKLSLWSL